MRQKAKKRKDQNDLSAPIYDNEKEKLINPLLFVIKLPMPRHPSLSLRQRRFFPFLQILKNRKSGHWFAGIAFDTNHFGLDIDDRFIVTEDLQPNLASNRRKNLEIDERTRLSDIFRQAFNPDRASTFRVNPSCPYRHACRDAMVQWRSV